MITGNQILGIGGAVALVASAVILAIRVKKEDIPQCYNAVSNISHNVYKKGNPLDLLNKFKKIEEE